MQVRALPGPPASGARSVQHSTHAHSSTTEERAHAARCRFEPCQAHQLPAPGRYSTAISHRIQRSPVVFFSFRLAPSLKSSVEFTGEPGVKRIVWLFSLVLGFSRLIWARFVVHQDLQTVLRCHIAALEAIGGVAREILYDRMKTAVLGEDGEGTIIYNRSLVDLARHYGFQPRA